jgi:lipid-binding SYLF domain-containing protein
MTGVSSIGLLAAVALLAFAPTGCGGSAKEAEAPSSAGAEVERVPGVEETIAQFKAKDPGIAQLLSDSAGYLVLPTVGEGAFIIGGGHGSGEAFEAGAYIGAVSVSELSIGAQVGGQSYSELVFFRTAQDIERLKQGTFEFSAEVTAVAAKRGAAKSASFTDGVMAFVLPKKGLMAAAAVGGQKISFTPAK